MQHRTEPDRRPGTAAHVGVVLLAAASGAVDTTAFLALGHVFAGVMTGNLALLGIALGGAHPADLASPLLALGGYVCGTALVATLTRGHTGSGPHWSPRIAVCLAGEAVLLTAGAVAWAAAHGAPGEGARDALLIGAAVAMGVQSGAMVAAGASGRPSTYLTGTLTVFLVRTIGTTSGAGPDPWMPGRLLALLAGAAAAAWLHRVAVVWTAAVPAALVTAALLTAVWHRLPRPAAGVKGR